MIFPFENLSPLRKRKEEKEFSVYKRISEEFMEFWNNIGGGGSLCFPLCKANIFFFPEAAVQRCSYEKVF